MPGTLGVAAGAVGGNLGITGGGAALGGALITGGATANAGGLPAEDGVTGFDACAIGGNGAGCSGLGADEEFGGRVVGATGVAGLDGGNGLGAGATGIGLAGGGGTTGVAGAPATDNTGFTAGTTGGDIGLGSGGLAIFFSAVYRYNIHCEAVQNRAPQL